MTTHRCPTCGELLSSPARLYACPKRGEDEAPPLLAPAPRTTLDIRPRAPRAAVAGRQGKVLDGLQAGPLTVAEVARLLDVSYQSAYNTLRALLAAGAIERAATKRWGPSRFRLAEVRA